MPNNNVVLLTKYEASNAISAMSHLSEGSNEQDSISLSEGSNEQDSMSLWDLKKQRCFEIQSDAYDIYTAPSVSRGSNQAVAVC